MGRHGAHRSFLPAFARRSFLVLIMLTAFHLMGGMGLQVRVIKDGLIAIFAWKSRKRNPMIPARSEADRIATFATRICPGSAYARFATKMAIVKPTPPSSAAPKMCAQFTLLGSEEILSFTIKKLKRKIPMGLPKIRPAKTPRNTGSVTMAPKLVPPSATSAFVRANSGKTAK